MTIKHLTLLIGIIFVLVGIAGFVPALAPAASDGSEAYLFGAFAVSPMHNSVHIVSGLLAIIASLASEDMCRLFYKVFGIIYALVTLIGMAVGHSMVMGVALNIPDTILHLVLAIGGLYLGFAHHLPKWVHEDMTHQGGHHA